MSRKYKAWIHLQVKIFVYTYMIIKNDYKESDTDTYLENCKK